MKSHLLIKLSIHDELASGTSRSASADAFTIKSLSDSL